MSQTTDNCPGSAIWATKKALANIENWNPHSNAILTALPREALDAAEALDSLTEAGGWQGLLHGMTISLKDNIDLAGQLTTAASWTMRDNRAARDAVVASRLKRSGAIIVGKANLHEFAFGPTSQSQHFGPCHNPWDLSRVAGGSSGGSGVSVATGMCVGSIGSDTAGSVRIPASFNGVAGLRPTVGRVPNRGSVPLSPAFDTLGPLARRVADVARIFSVIAGFDPEDPLSVREPVPNVLAALQTGIGGLRLGVMRQFFFEHLDPELVERLEEVLAVYRELGVDIVELDPLGDIAEINMKMALRVQVADAYAVHLKRLEREREAYGSDLLVRFEQGSRVTGAEYADALRCMEGWRHRLAAEFTQVDAILSPTTPYPAPLSAEVENIDSAARQAITRCTVAWSFAGVPSLALPCGHTRDGLPLSMQLTARWFDEATLFALGHAFQTVTEHHLIEPDLPWL